MSDKQNSKKRKSRVIEIAKQYGLDGDYFFESTFKRYEEQIEILDSLKKSIDEDGCTVSKEYVKGRKNQYIHPAVDAYNKAVTAANQTATTLVKIVQIQTQKNDPEVKDELLEVLGI